MANLYPKTLTQEQFDLKHEQEMEIATRELGRRSLDTIRIFNPLPHAFRYMQDRYWHNIPAKSYMDVPRYLARHFFKKICDYMIGEQISLQGEALKKKREEQMGSQFLDHYEENVQIWNKVPRMNDPDLIKEIRKTVIIGLVKEYGLDEPEKELDRIPEEQVGFGNVHEQVFDDMNEVVSEAVEIPVKEKVEEKAPLYISKKDRLKMEATNEI